MDNPGMTSARSFILFACLTGCSSGAGPSETSTGGATAAAPRDEPVASAPQASQPGSASRVLGQLRTRDQRVTLLTGSDGLHVTVQNGSGAIVAEDIAIDELRQRDPLLYDLCRSSVASNHYLDARLDVPRETRPRAASWAAEER
jgi:hypothetical protein